jgi:hypothetical protein
LNPDESIPTNSCPIFVRIMNDEIIFSSRVSEGSEIWYM